MNTPDHLRYTAEHEWVQIDSGKARIGITDHAQHQLGDIVFLELPAVGLEVAVQDAFAVVESVKAASDIYAPVAGTVVEVNEALVEAPETVNQAPYEGGWMVVIEMSNPAEAEGLLSADAYRKLVEEDG